MNMRGRYEGRVTLLAVAALAVVALAGSVGTAVGDDGVAAPDSIRTNLWLTEALMADVVKAAARVLPAPPARILMEDPDSDPESEVFLGVASREFMAAGYELFRSVGDDEEATPPETDVDFGYRVAGVELSYPEVGRTLGIWRRWIDRDLTVSVHLEIVESASGRVLLNDRVTRTFSDRIPDGVFDDVDSGMYTFTTAETSESGWQRRTEEIVVLGALAGLVAVYFANTNN